MDCVFAARGAEGGVAADRSLIDFALAIGSINRRGHLNLFCELSALRVALNNTAIEGFRAVSSAS
jgi:hypothetical protein